MLLLSPSDRPFFLLFSYRVLHSLTEVDRGVRASSTEYVWICHCLSAHGQVESGGFLCFLEIWLPRAMVSLNALVTTLKGTLRDIPALL